MTSFCEPSTALTLNPLMAFDPRDGLDGKSLIEASRNAYPIVATSRPRRDSLGLATGSAIAVILGMLTFWTMHSHRSVPASASTPTEQRPARVLSPPVTDLTPQAAPTQTGALVMPRTLPLASTRPFTGAPIGLQAPAPMIVFDSGGLPSVPARGLVGDSATVGSPAGLASAAQASATGASTNGDEGFFSRIEGRNAQVAVAHQLSNPGSTVTQGTLIAAVLETSINTDVPGYVRALVSRDIRSFDGSQVLIPRSSRLIGQYKSGLAAGQTRAYVIWTRLIRPDGVSVTLDSPGVDFSGEAGLPGKVSSHFMKRFGSALLLSVVGGVSAIGTGGAALVAGSAGQSAASVAASRDGAIPPTIRVSQGEPIRVFTARDLDFSSVPRLTASR